MPSPIIAVGGTMVNKTDKISGLVEHTSQWECRFRKQINISSPLILVRAKQERKKGLGWRVIGRYFSQGSQERLLCRGNSELRIECLWTVYPVCLRQRNHLGKRKRARLSVGDKVWLGKVHCTEL